MNSSPRSIPEARIAAPTSRSLSYEAAVSTMRYPSAIAVSTAAIVSSGGLWKTPSPRTGIATPLFSVKVGGVVFVVIRLLLGLDLELEDFALVHQPVALGHLVERAGSVEDAARLDATFEHVRQQLFD